jgi:toxin HigB-1
MIRSFKDKRSATAFAGIYAPVWRSMVPVLKRKLDMLDAATELDDLRSPPGNRLEKLGGDRAGQWSIRVNGQWRICFVWRDGAAEEVEIVDYH